VGWHGDPVSPALFLDVALYPALRLLPVRMDSPEARALIVTITLQESELKARRQHGGGPARSYLQFERAGIRGVLTHRTSAVEAVRICKAVDVDATVDAVYRAIEFHDPLAVCFARLLLWTLPDFLPQRTEAQAGWDQYLAAWRPGKPHRQTWDRYFRQAWNLV
jgi:hypothetical protein